MLRTAIVAVLACALAVAAIAAPAFAVGPQDAANAAAPGARCEETTFRIYFREDASLDPMAREILQMAENNMAECAYRELHVAVDARNPLARQRAAAIMSATSTQTWNVARIEPRATSAAGGPDYAEVMMTPRAMGAAAPLPTQTPRGEVGV